MPTETGKINRISGMYESVCHPREQMILAGQPFPRCGSCNRETRWILVRLAKRKPAKKT
jgi:hypothetical protein